MSFYAIVFSLRPPDIPRLGHFLQRKNACKSFFLRVSKNTLYPPHGQNQNHGFSFGVSVSPFLLPVSKEKVVLVSGKVVIVLVFSFCLKEPCPSFPWLFCFHQGKPPNLPRIFFPCRTHKTLEKREKTPILARKILGKNQPRKSKQSRKGRTGKG